MDITKAIVKVLPAAVKNKPEVVGAIVEKAPKVLFWTGVATVGAGSVVLAKGSVDGGHIVKDFCNEMTVIKSDLINDGVDNEAARARYFEKRNAAVKHYGKKALKHYGPGVGMIVAGETMQGLGFGSVSGQLATTAASLAASQVLLSKISKNAESKFGKQIRDELFYGGEIRKLPMVSTENSDTPVYEDKDALVIKDKNIEYPWTFNFEDSDYFKPNCMSYNVAILTQHEAALVVKLKERIQSHPDHIGYLTIYEILCDLGFKIPADRPITDYMIYGIVKSDLDEINSVMVYSDVWKQFLPGDGFTHYEGGYIVEIPDVVNVYEYLKNR